MRTTTPCRLEAGGELGEGRVLTAGGHGGRGWSGVTLLETLIATGIGAVVLVVALGLYSTTQRVLDRQQVEAARLGRQTDLLSLLRRDIRSAALVDPESSQSRLILVAGDGSRVIYASGPEGVRREGVATGLAVAVNSVETRARFGYPEGPRGSLVRVTWGEGTAPRVITLHLRNHET